MLRNPDLSWPALAGFSRSMARLLEAGVEIRKSLQTSAKQSGDKRLAPAVERLKSGISGGASLAEAVRSQQPLFPELYCALVDVGEQTGHLPEVFESLAKYYEDRLLMQRDFRSSAAWPVIQLIAAIGIIGLLIFILGILPPAGKDGRPFDVTGLGLAGTSGALTWLAGWAAVAAGLTLLWKYSRNSFAGQQMLDPWLIQIPVLGTCLQSFAIARFAWCFALTQKAGMSIRPSLDCSLQAAGNGAFLAAGPGIWRAVSGGETLTDALSRSGLFTTEFLQIVATAEESGTVPEQLDRLSRLFHDEARRSMTRLTKALSGLVWFLTAGLIVYFIFRIAMIYVGILNDAVGMAG